MPADLRLGVIGAGWAARAHCSSLSALAGVRVVGVFDVDVDGADRLAGELGVAPVPTVEDLLSTRGLDAVIVATPSGAHRESVVPALELGVAVFVEKPLAHTVVDATAIADVARRSGTVCAVGYQWRALDSLDGLRSEVRDSGVALLLSQGIGITQARSWFDDRRLSGGLMFERVSHHLDLQRHFAGEVRTVSAVAGQVPLCGAGRSGSDVLSLSLSYACGAVGAVHVGWVPEGYPGTQSLRLFTPVTGYDVELDPSFVVRRHGGADGVASSGEPPFRRQLRRFVDAVRARDPAAVFCDPGQAAATVAVAAAAERALVTGARHVVPWDPAGTLSSAEEAR